MKTQMPNSPRSKNLVMVDHAATDSRSARAFLRGVERDDSALSLNTAPANDEPSVCKLAVDVFYRVGPAAVGLSIGMYLAARYFS